MHGIYKKPNNAVEKSGGLHLAVQPTGVACLFKGFSSLRGIGWVML